MENNKTQYYEPKKLKDLNWKRISIILSIILSLITGAILLWLFAWNGLAYSKYKKMSKNLYSALTLDLDENKMDNFAFVNDELKSSSQIFVAKLNEIYTDKEQYPNGLTSIDNVIQNYKYKNRDITHKLSIAKNDYLFGLSDSMLESHVQKVEKENKAEYTQVFNTLLTDRIVIRIKNNKVAAIGLTYENNNSVYRYLDGSLIDGIGAK